MSLRSLQHQIEKFIPGWGKVIAKRVFWRSYRTWSRIRYIRRGRLSEIWMHFRFTRKPPFSAEIGERSIVEEYGVWNAKSGSIKIGDRCWIGMHNVLTGPMEIGDDVSTGPYVCMLGPHHPRFSDNDSRHETTKIGDRAWIATGVILLHGVHIGADAVISPGAFVTKDVPPGAFIAGNPARDFSKLRDAAWNNHTQQKKSSKAENNKSEVRIP